MKNLLGCTQALLAGYAPACNTKTTNDKWIGWCLDHGAVLVDRVRNEGETAIPWTKFYAGPPELVDRYAGETEKGWSPPKHK